jgi:ankyrin repeat protein
LHMAIQSRKASPEKTLQTVELLLAAGADLNKTDNYGNLPIDLLVADPNTSPALLECLQPSKPPIFEAFNEGSLTKVEELLAADKELVSTRYRGHTTLQLCLSSLLSAVEESSALEKANNLLTILKALLHAGSDPNVSNPEGTDEEDLPPLHRTCCALRELYRQQQEETDTVHLLEETVQTLLKAGATVPTVTTHLLHDAARRNETNMARFLIETMHVDPNTAGRQGMTPLQFAARSGRMGVLEYLLLEVPNIDVHARDDRGQTALDAAKANQHKEAAAALEDYSYYIAM